MPVFFNPASPLTANRVPVALGGGRLGDSPVGIQGSDTVFLDRPANSKLMVREAGLDGLEMQVSARTAYLSVVQSGYGMVFRVNGSSAVGSIAPSGNWCFGSTTDSANGRVQLNSHSALGGGLAFGSLTDGTETLWRTSAGSLRTNGSLTLRTIALLGAGPGFTPTCSIQSDATDTIRFINSVGGHARIDAAAATGWALPTGTLTRSTFDAATVTLPQLAERVAALITDFHRSSTRHGLLTT